ncbi:MAG TPA: zinc ribbon domain-containing protein, partial [Sandaracinaceae bacterium LLY-WYZ-13_1]|nr:zinc ribbon domain-containing protein [Sandaracinaceae bacterium LLY-WYZ-13_1]
MLYCQKCGAGNVEDARFCNMCGTKIATEGEPGGPIGEAGEEGPASTLHGHVEPSASEPPPAARDASDDAAEADTEPARMTTPEPAASKKASKKASRSKAEASNAEASKEKPPPFESEPVNVWEESEKAKDTESSEDLNVSTMSLSAMGVRSRGGAWATLLGVAALFVGLGALGAWFFLRSDAASDPVAQAGGGEDAQGPGEGGADPDDEVVIGDPVPPGETIPEVVSSTPTPRSRGRSRSGAGSRG